MQVLSLSAAADLGGMSRRHLERLVAAGKGPATIRMSPGRVGILESDWRVWLLANRSLSASQMTAEEFVRGLMIAFRDMPASAAPKPAASLPQAA